MLICKPLIKPPATFWNSLLSQKKWWSSLGREKSAESLPNWVRITRQPSSPPLRPIRGGGQAAQESTHLYDYWWRTRALRELEMLQPQFCYVRSSATAVSRRMGGSIPRVSSRKGVPERLRHNYSSLFAAEGKPPKNRRTSGTTGGSDWSIQRRTC
jgi:hypothetical protein